MTMQPVGTAIMKIDSTSNTRRPNRSPIHAEHHPAQRASHKTYGKNAERRQQAGCVVAYGKEKLR